MAFRSLRQIHSRVAGGPRRTAVLKTVALLVLFVGGVWLPVRNAGRVLVEPPLPAEKPELPTKKLVSLVLDSGLVPPLFPGMGRER